MDIHRGFRRWSHSIIMVSVLLGGFGLVPVAAAQSNCATTVTVQSGDTLFGIASFCGVTLSDVELANPQITNPNLIFPGQQINIPSGSIIPVTGQSAQVTLAPVSGAPSSLVTITGANFPANASLTLTAGAQGTAPTSSVGVLTDSTGGFTAQMFVPADIPSETTWIFTATTLAGGGPSAFAFFQVTAQPPTGFYAVQSGDTLTSLAQRFNTSVFGLVRANPQIANLNALAVGQLLFIPGSMVSVSGQSVYIVQSGDTLGNIAASRGLSLAALEAANPQIMTPGLIFPGDHIVIP